MSGRRTYDIRWKRATEEEIHTCHGLTAERLVSRLRNALRENQILILAVEPEETA
jgi:hypothetical protein